MNVPETEIGGPGGAFPSTTWAQVTRWRHGPAAGRRQILERLLAAYWKPVYGLIRQSWARSNEDAKDLTQEFFVTEILEGTLLDRFDPARGNFRAFLKGALLNFMRRVTRDAARQKRGGDAKAVPLHVGEVDLAEIVPDGRALTPEQVFDRAWKRVVLARAVDLLERRLRARGKQTSFEVFRRYDLEPGAEGPSYKQLARELGIDADDVKNHLTRAREEFTTAVSDIVAEYVDDPADVARELDTLFEP